MAIEDVLLAIAPEFALVAPARLTTFIDFAENQISQTLFEGDYELVVAYLAAHMLALSERNSNAGNNGQAGSITSKKEGDLSLGYGSPATTNNSDVTLFLTSYGIEFVRLRDMHIISPRTFYECY